MARFVAAHPDPSTLLAQQAKDLGLDPAHPVARKFRPCPLAISRCCGANGMRKPRSISPHRRRRGAPGHSYFRAGGGRGRLAHGDRRQRRRPQPQQRQRPVEMIEEPPPRSLFLIVAHQRGDSSYHHIALPPADPQGAYPRADRGPRAPRSTWRAKNPTRTPLPALAPAPMVLRGRLCGCCRSPTPPSMAWSNRGLAQFAKNRLENRAQARRRHVWPRWRNQFDAFLNAVFGCWEMRCAKTCNRPPRPSLRHGVGDAGARRPRSANL